MISVIVTGPPLFDERNSMPSIFRTGGLLG